MRIHLVFHVALLEPTLRNVKLNVIIEVEEKELEYEVKVIFDFKLIKSITKYLIKWKGYSYNKNI